MTERTEMTDYEREVTLRLARLTVQHAPEGVSPEIAAACGVTAGLVSQGLEVDDDTHRELTEAVLTAIAAEDTELKTPWRFEGLSAFDEEYWGQPCYARDATDRQICVFGLDEDEVRTLVEIVNRYHQSYMKARKEQKS